MKLLKKIFIFSILFLLFQSCEEKPKGFWELPNTINVKDFQFIHLTFEYKFDSTNNSFLVLVPNKSPYPNKFEYMWVNESSMISEVIYYLKNSNKFNKKEIDKISSWFNTLLNRTWDKYSNANLVSEENMIKKYVVKKNKLQGSLNSSLRIQELKNMQTYLNKTKEKLENLNIEMQKFKPIKIK
jgi:hypothetical protein